MILDTLGYAPVCIDWLTINQRYAPGSLPVVGSMLVHYANLDTGEVERELVYGHQFEGSFDTSVRVRCDGTSVEVSGNPSRLNRLDNILGFQSIDDSIQVYNRVLVLLGLPQFTSGERTNLVQFARSDAVVPDGQAIITRVDLTRNYSLGSHGEALRCLRWLSGQQIQGKPGHLYADGCTVDWFRGSRRVYAKYYVKAVSMLREGKKQGLKIQKDLYEWGQCDPYQVRLADWCMQNGVVRHEVSFKAMKLKDEGLDKIGKWSMVRMEEIMQGYQVHERSIGGISQYETISEELQQQGIDRGRAVRAQQAALSWLAGYDLKGNMSKSAYYRVRSLLFSVGLDISLPCDVSRLPIQIKTVEMRPLAVPGWYKRAA